jgi:putative ABC transport system permease protein
LPALVGDVTVALPSLLEDLFADLRFGFRQLLRNPIVSLACVFTLALGIGANVAIFSVVHAVLLRALPFPTSDRLVDLTEYKLHGVDSGGASYPDYLAWKEQNTVFAEIAAYSLINASNDIVLGGPLSTERERYSTVTNSFFTLLDVQPALGHGFSSRDELPGGDQVFLISDTVWHTVFSSDPRALYKNYLLDGETYTLIGVMPPGFDFPKNCGVWLPTSTLGNSGLHDRISHPYHVLGRLGPGTTLVQAESQIEALQENQAKSYPNTDADWHARAKPLLNEIVGDVRNSLFVLLGAVGFVLLIACTNVVNLLLARALVRKREFAIRSALGAGRSRLLRQHLTEIFLLVSISIVMAIFFAKWGLALAVSLTSVHLPRMESFQLHIPVLAFASLLAALTTVLVGLAPALQASQPDPQSSLRDGRHASGFGFRGRRIGNLLVVSETALALLLLCGAGLMLRSFMQLRRVNPGFQTEHLLTLKIALPSGAYPNLEQARSYLDRLMQRLPTLPGVQSAAAASTLPLSGESDWGTFLIADGSAPDWSKASATDWRGVTSAFFQTLRIPLLRGREFTPADEKNQNAVIINEAAAKKFWSAADPLGRTIFTGHENRPLEIIGIVGNVKGTGPNEPAKPEMYTPLRGFWYAFLALRTNQEPSRLASAVRQEITALDPGVPVYQVATMDQLLRASVTTQRFDLFLLALFAALALGLAAIGIYGVLSSGVSRRSREIGIRLAVGAQPRDVLRLVLREGMQLVGAGVLLGIAGALALTRLMAGLIYGISATDPVTFLAVSFLLIIVALLACYLPASRAMRVNPIEILRSE